MLSFASCYSRTFCFGISRIVGSLPYTQIFVWPRAKQRGAFHKFKKAILSFNEMKSILWYIPMKQNGNTYVSNQNFKPYSQQIPISTFSKKIDPTKYTAKIRETSEALSFWPTQPHLAHKQHTISIHVDSPSDKDSSTKFSGDAEVHRSRFTSFHQVSFH